RRGVRPNASSEARAQRIAGVAVAGLLRIATAGRLRGATTGSRRAASDATARRLRLFSRLVEIGGDPHPLRLVLGVGERAAELLFLALRALELGLQARKLGRRTLLVGEQRLLAREPLLLRVAPRHRDTDAASEHDDAADGHDELEALLRLIGAELGELRLVGLLRRERFHPGAVLGLGLGFLDFGLPDRLEPGGLLLAPPLLLPAPLLLF